MHKHKLRVYVAGCWKKKDELRISMDLLEELNFEITHDWTSVEKKHGADVNTRTRMQTDQDGLYAKADIDGVVNADVVFFIMDQENYVYRGTFCEMGAALASKKPIIVLGPQTIQASTNIFYWHPSIVCRTLSWDDSIEMLFRCRDYVWKTKAIACFMCLFTIYLIEIGFAP